MFFLHSVFHKIFYKTILRKLLRRTTLIQYIGARGLLLGGGLLIGLGFWGFVVFRSFLGLGSLGVLGAKKNKQKHRRGESPSVVRHQLHQKMRCILGWFNQSLERVSLPNSLAEFDFWKLLQS